MKALSLNGLEIVFNLLKRAPSENQYYVELQSNVKYSFTVPSYVDGRSIVEVYVNGLRMILNLEYTVSSTGVINILNEVHNEGNYVHIIHRKYGG